MATSRSLQQAVRLALATATAVTGVSTLYGQEAPAPAAAAAPVEEVVVTGSRLVTPNQTAISPVTSVSATDIQQTGLTRVEDILNNLPMVFAGMNSTTSNGADGTATVDLRGLGNQRTLVLVNGLRLGPGSALGGRNFSDINQIPAPLIQRVDILTGGASAVYGADAVAGVVNFILNTHFEGVRVDAGYHFNKHDNSNQAGVNSVVEASGFPFASGNVNTAFGKSASVLVGSNFADNRGNATVYVTYDKQGEALQSKFDYSACTIQSRPIAKPDHLVCGGSSTSAKNGAGGRWQAYSGPSNSGALFVDNTVDGANHGNFRPFTSPQDLFNYGPLNFYQVPNERWTAGGFLNFDVNSHVNVYASVMWMRNNSQAQIAPSGDFGNASFIACANPLLNASQQAVFCNPANQALQGNPFETFNGINYPGLNIYGLRRNVEGGNRVATFLTNSAHEVVGVKGDFGDSQNAWTYNAYGSHATVDTAFGNLNYVSNTAVEQALNVLPSAKGPVCGGPTNALGVGPLVTQGTAFSANPACVPWNVWTPNGVTPAQAQSLAIPEQAQGTVTEYVVNGSVTGDLGKYGVKLPTANDGLLMNIGLEWRQDNSDFEPDYVSQQGLAAGGGGATPPVVGSFSVREIFTELRMPLMQEQPLAQDLSVEGGYRYSKYSEGFDTNTYKFGIDWAPVRDIRFRGSYQRAVRAPNIGELYTPIAVGLDGSLDPCAVPLADKTNPTGPLENGVTLAQCERTGVTPKQYGHISANSAFQYNGNIGGNPNLKPETADTYTVGFVFTPTFVQNLNFSVDYYDIKIKDIIGPITANAILGGCIDPNASTAQESYFCSLVHRSSSGSLWLSASGYVQDVTQNLGELKTKGVDVKASWRWQMSRFGSLLFSLEGVDTINRITTPVPQFSLNWDCVGFYGAVCGGSNPKWRHVFNTTWSTPWNGWDLGLRWRYIGSQASEQTSGQFMVNASGAAPAYPPLSHIAAYNYIDLYTDVNLFKGITLSLGVNNVADKVPPLVLNADCTTSSPAGANCNGNTFPGVYDALGRYLFANIRAQF